MQILVTCSDPLRCRHGHFNFEFELFCWRVWHDVAWKVRFVWCHIWDREIILIMIVLGTLELYTLITWESTFLDSSIQKEWENIAWRVYLVIIPEVYWIPSKKDILLRVECYSATSVFKETKITEVLTDCFSISEGTVLLYIWQQKRY